jgi:thioesterase domain-containing protein
MHDSVLYINEYIHSNIPLTKAMQLSVTRFDSDGLIMEAPLGPNINDKGTAFGGSLAAILTLAGWALTVLVLRESGLQANVMVYHSVTDYRKPVTGKLIISAFMPDSESKNELIRSFSESGKARWSVSCSALSENGEPAVIYTGKYAAVTQ